jgi:phosphoribosylaminoimidazole (AIR) synthetase
MTIKAFMGEPGYQITIIKGIPIYGKSYQELTKKVKDGEVLVALYAYGPHENLLGARKLTNEAAYDEYMEMKFSHKDFYAVKRDDLKGVNVY